VHTFTTPLNRHPWPAIQNKLQVAAASLTKPLDNCKNVASRSVDDGRGVFPLFFRRGSLFLLGGGVAGGGDAAAEERAADWLTGNLKTRARRPVAELLLMLDAECRMLPSRMTSGPQLNRCNSNKYTTKKYF